LKEEKPPWSFLPCSGRTSLIIREASNVTQISCHLSEARKMLYRKSSIIVHFIKSRIKLIVRERVNDVIATEIERLETDENLPP